MARAKSRFKWWLVPLVVIALTSGLLAWLLRPSDLGQTTVTVPKGASLGKVLRDLSAQGILHSAILAGVIARVSHIRSIREGVYIIRPHATIGQVFKDLSVRVEVPVRCPEGYWIARTAASLQKQGFCEAQDYVGAAGAPSQLAAGPNNEGKLYPDTYMMSPNASARELVQKQQAAYQSKIAPLLVGKDANHILTVASMVELEASDPEERRVIAGIIENRLAKNMRLEIDATVLFAIQEWKVLPPGFVHTVDSPYNTYEHAGLPPGPICSPSLSSVKAALNPTKTDYLFYVSKGGDRHLFARTYQEHQANIRLVRSAGKP